MQNIGFSDSGYVIKSPHPSSAVHGAPPFTGYLFCFAILMLSSWHFQVALQFCQLVLAIYMPNLKNLVYFQSAWYINF